MDEGYYLVIVHANTPVRIIKNHVVGRANVCIQNEWKIESQKNPSPMPSEFLSSDENNV